jgi:hypothetical protein
MSMNIRIEVLGRIEHGLHAGGYVKIVDDTINTGGYLILVATERSLSNSFDDWVEDQRSLEAYFKECDWRVEWIE